MYTMLVDGSAVFRLGTNLTQNSTARFYWSNQIARAYPLPVTHIRPYSKITPTKHIYSNRETSSNWNPLAIEKHRRIKIPIPTETIKVLVVFKFSLGVIYECVYSRVQSIWRGVFTWWIKLERCFVWMPRPRLVWRLCEGTADVLACTYSVIVTHIRCGETTTGRPSRSKTTESASTLLDSGCIAGIVLMSWIDLRIDRFIKWLYFMMLWLP